MSQVLYEVTLSVDADIAADYLHWLQDHVAEMLALPGFVQARIWQVDEPRAQDGRVQYCCHYTLSDAAALAAYLAEHAPRMRADGKQRFGDRFSAQRRILAPVT
ncbi:DUF4286 family protein [Arenimonas sp. MALMAid1274]|uniref:DUF4286 family protein n=1 Tax=Arenimonas sp. MALMAid1274 TaxID=3411630 RepID=UPI003BA0BD01